MIVVRLAVLEPPMSSDSSLSLSVFILCICKRQPPFGVACDWWAEKSSCPFSLSIFLPSSIGKQNRQSAIFRLISIQVYSSAAQLSVLHAYHNQYVFKKFHILHEFDSF